MTIGIPSWNAKDGVLEAIEHTFPKSIVQQPSDKLLTNGLDGLGYHTMLLLAVTTPICRSTEILKNKIKH